MRHCSAVQPRTLGIRSRKELHSKDRAEEDKDPDCAKLVYTIAVKNITLSADGDLIEQARLLARAQHKTLNALFREWLERYTSESGNLQDVDRLMKRMAHVRPGRRFTR